MANEESAREKKAKKASYENARMKLKRSGRTDSIAAAVRNNNLPSDEMDKMTREAGLADDDGLINGISPKRSISDMTLASAVLEGAKIFKSAGSVALNYEEMNNRQMAAGQLFQNIAYQIVSNPEWQERWMAVMGPETVIKMFDFGVKIERQAMTGNLAMAHKKESDKDSAGEGELDLVDKLLDDPDLVDAVHGLVDDDEADEN